LFQKTTTIAHIANHAPEFGTETGSLEYYGNALKNLFGKIEKYIITPIEERREFSKSTSINGSPIRKKEKL